MSANVIDLDAYRYVWRPVLLACYWCGSAEMSVVKDGHDRFACDDCGMFASTITHEAPDGWSEADLDELEAAEFEPVR